MSVIYRSLQQLKKEENVRNARQTPQAVAPRMSKLIIRAVLITAVFVLLVGTSLFFIKQEVQEIKIPEAPDLPRSAASSIQGREGAVQEILEGDITAEDKVQQLAQAPAAEPVQQQPILKQRLRREVKPKDKALDLSKPTKALEKHFATKARKNESVIALERKLVESSKSGNLDQSREILSNMASQIGRKESTTQYKWQGYLALKEKRYADAENFYRRAVALRPSDFNSNLNLVFSLMGQNKRSEAVKAFRVLLDRYPMDERVQKLGKQLGQL